ncbi:hypothetical protein ABZP36_035787 [Zizania latifolia]
MAILQTGLFYRRTKRKREAVWFGPTTDEHEKKPKSCPSPTAVQAPPPLNRPSPIPQRAAAEGRGLKTEEARSSRNLGTLSVRRPPRPAWLLGNTSDGARHSARAPASPPRAGLPSESSFAQGYGRRAGVSSLSVRAKESDDFIALVSEKPAEAESAQAKRERWEGFGREVSDGDAEVQMQGESASWNVLNQIGVEVSASARLFVTFLILNE